MPKHRNGGKISKRHTTVIDAATTVVDALNKMPGVKKIALGEIMKVKNGQRSLKVAEAVNNGLKLTVRGNCYLQVIYVTANNPHVTKDAIEKIFAKQKGG